MRRVAGVLLVLAVGCGSDASPPARAPRAGTLVGDIPRCYGPGPDLNLRPTPAVEVRRDGAVVTSATFRADDDEHTYRFELEPGDYEVRLPGVASAPATVRSGETTTADLTAPPCV
ncbi:MAG TPA: hypothetical protein VGX28_00760 [Frankiaceae bacterium]|jgi:hypothetical protein|nr:hypothetical protein [Frankiaceae bacterium]